jgi:hypothetical protein
MRPRPADHTIGIAMSTGMPTLSKMMNGNGSARKAERNTPPQRFAAVSHLIARHKYATPQATSTLESHAGG